MTDKELLELAALAAGIECDAKGPFTSVSRYDLYNGIHTVDLPWNPIGDDGDALRLAVKLELEVMCGSVRTEDFSICIPIKASTEMYAATRYAIVRAAAEIGKSMKGLKWRVK